MALNRKLKVVFVLFLASLFLQVGTVHAAVEGFSSDCLDPIEVDDDEHVATLVFPAPGTGHLLPQPNEETWIFVCITTPDGQKCTTGIPATDEKVFGKSTDFAYLKTMPIEGVGVGGIKDKINPDNTNSDSTNPQFIRKKVWNDHYSNNVDHMWYWLQVARPIDETGGAAAGNLGSQQQATFDFMHQTPESSECTIIRWDPRGYVFDAKTLHPVKDIWVTLSKGPQGGIFTDVPSGLGLTNPDQSTSTNGQFSFYVDPGFYKLKLSNAKIAPLAEINPASQSLFLDTKGKTNIYQEGNEVQEVQGSVKIAHIPITVTDSNLLITTLNVLEKRSGGVGKQIHIFGRVSHPKSKMILTMTTLTEEGMVKDMVKVESTDDLGEYDKYIDQEFTDATNGKKLLVQNLNVSFELNSFYTTGVFSNNSYTEKALSFFEHLVDYAKSKIFVNAASNSSYNVKPIPTYIDGLAYDAKGVVIPKAVVGIYPFFSENPMYVTVADETGRYKIGSQHLPKLEYNLRYKKLTGEVIVIDTGTFIKQNAVFFAKAGVKPYEEKNTTLAEDKKVQDYFTDTKTTRDLELPGQKSASNNKPTSSRDQNVAQAAGGIMSGGMQGIIMIVVVLMVLVMIGVGAFIMMKSKQQPPSQF